MMDIRRALLLADPDTRELALGEYARNCHLRSATLEVACEILGEEYKRVSAERDAAVKDLEDLMTEADRAACQYCADSMGEMICPACEPRWRGLHKEAN